MTATATNPIIAKAQEAARYFETAKRGEDDYTRLKDGSPEWLTDLVHEAHGDMLPDDWRYQFIREAVDAIAEADDDATLEDLPYEHEVSVYTGDQLAWLGSRVSRYSYVDDRVETTGHGDSVMDDISAGMHGEWTETFELVLAALTNLTV